MHGLYGRGGEGRGGEGRRGEGRGGEGRGGEEGRGRGGRGGEGREGIVAGKGRNEKRAKSQVKENHTVTVYMKLSVL